MLTINNIPFIETEIERLEGLTILSQEEETQLSEYKLDLVKLSHKLKVIKIIDFLYNNNSYLLRRETIENRYADDGLIKLYCFYFKAKSNEDLKYPKIRDKVSDMKTLESIIFRIKYNGGIYFGNYKNEDMIKFSISQKIYDSDLDYANFINNYFQSDLW